MPTTVTEKSIFPFAGISNSKTIFCNENGYYSIYESDRYVSTIQIKNGSKKF